MPAAPVLMISPITAVILVIVVAVLGFVGWKVASVSRTAAREAREREMTLLAGLPLTPTLSVLSDAAPTLDGLTLPSAAPSPALSAVAVVAGPAAVAPSQVVEDAVTVLRAGAHRVWKAAATGGDSAAAEELVRVLDEAALTALVGLAADAGEGAPNPVA